MSAERFWKKVRKTDECWLWEGAINSKGYGSIHRALYGEATAHRYSYVTSVGPIPEGLDLDHLCRIRHCVRPTHLEPVARRINILRGNSLQALNARKTTCDNGHVFDEHNTYIFRGYRLCRSCNRAAVGRYKTRKRAERATQ